jgi:hypothetical protein
MAWHLVGGLDWLSTVEITLPSSMTLSGAAAGLDSTGRLTMPESKVTRQRCGWRYERLVQVGEIGLEHEVFMA